jgi:hypothetical protein
MNSLSLLQALAFEPKKAFAEIAGRPRFLLPLVLLVVASAGIVFWYYQVVDLEWMMDRQLRTSAFTSQLTDAQIETQVKAASTNRGMQGAIATVATALGVVLVQLLYAAYLLLAAKSPTCSAASGSGLHCCAGPACRRCLPPYRRPSC